MEKKPDSQATGRFTSALEEYGPQLYRFLVYRLGNREDARDLAQEAYLRLLRIDPEKVIEKPKSYLFRIASNLANEFTLQQKRTPPITDLDSLVAIGDPGDQHQFEKSLEQQAMIRQLEKILENFPPAYRAILLMKKRDGLSRSEIAKKLGISVHTVKKYLTRATARCREELLEGSDT